MTTQDSHKPRMLVTAATGKTGTAVTRQLLEKGYPVTALVRREDTRSAALAKAGATIVIGDLIEPDETYGRPCRVSSEPTLSRRGHPPSCTAR